MHDDYKIFDLIVSSSDVANRIVVMSLLKHCNTNGNDGVFNEYINNSDSTESLRQKLNFLFTDRLQRP